MKDVLLKKLFKLTFYLVFLSTFVFGGSLQLFFGVPNTLITYLSVIALSFFVLFYIILKKRIIFNNTTGLFIVFALLILMSGIINKSGFVKTSLYFLFFLTPLSTYLFFRINFQNEYISGYLIRKIFFFIACAQLPIMIFQKYAYPILAELNRSNQGIIEADIMFGSLFLKADHALGLFLLFNIFNIVINNHKKQVTKYPVLMYLYLGFTILYSESNITKLILLVFTAYAIYRAIPRKAKSIGLVISVIMMFFFINKAKEIKAVRGEIIFMENEYNPKKSYRNFERGIAKRPQVVISYATKIPAKIIGDGPYSYFDIIKGEFKLTKHFSQLIWSYADLGIIGVLLVVIILYNLIKSLYLPRYIFIPIFLIIIIYSFMTTIFSDLAIMITLCGLLQIRNKY